LEGVGKEERVFGNHSDLPYCSKMCVKRDWKENNHASVVNPNPETRNPKTYTLHPTS
jgi:hypothetical protein